MYVLTIFFTKYLYNVVRHLEMVNLLLCKILYNLNMQHNDIWYSLVDEG